MINLRIPSTLLPLPYLANSVGDGMGDIVIGISFIVMFISGIIFFKSLYGLKGDK